MSEVSPLRPEDPARLGMFTLLGRIGQGGQGVVFLGRSESGEQVAVKLLQAFLRENDPARNRFVRELSTAKRVARFCTAQVLDADIAGDRPYIVSEYVAGPSLAEQVTTSGTVRGSALERLAVGTATALAAIHQAGIVHRDFKPGNVLLGNDGPRVIDFGVAKALDPGSTGSSAVVGTPSYMAPEQVGAAEVGPPADVWAWGATMVYAANGRPPFGADTIPAVMGRILDGEPELGETPEPLRSLVLAALSKDPAGRPTAQDLLMRLIGHGGEVPDIMAEGRTLAAQQPQTRPYGPPAGAPPYLSPAGPGTTFVPGGPARPGPGGTVADGRGRRGWLIPVAVAAVVLLLGGAVGAWALWGRDDEPGARRPDVAASRSSSGPAASSSSAATGATAEPAPASLVVTPSGSVTLPAGQDSTELTLTAEGGGIEWSAEEETSLDGGKLLSLSRAQGALGTGQSQKLRVTVNFGADRQAGNRTLRISVPGAQDQRITINWSG